MSTVTKVARVRDRLRAAGRKVVEVPGWETRGSGTLTPRGYLNHHTAGPRSGDSPSLRICTYGRSDLRNSLCMWFVSRSGVIYLVAAKTSWHAGSGTKGSNSSLGGTEAEHTGLTNEPWTAGSLESQALINKFMAEEFGYSIDRTYEHKEHTSRKIDRVHFKGPEWRARLKSGASTKEWDEMATQAEVEAVVRRVVKEELDKWSVGFPGGEQAPVKNRVLGADVNAKDAVALIRQVLAEVRQ